MKIKSPTYWQDHLNAWFQAGKKKGLVDVKFTVSRVPGGTVEDVCREALLMLHSPRYPILTNF